jgi:hypothetical protein
MCAIAHIAKENPVATTIAHRARTSSSIEHRPLGGRTDHRGALDAVGQESGAQRLIPALGMPDSLTIPKSVMKSPRLGTRRSFIVRVGITGTDTSVRSAASFREESRAVDRFEFDVHSSAHGSEHDSALQDVSTRAQLFSVTNSVRSAHTFSASLAIWSARSA